MQLRTLLEAVLMQGTAEDLPSAREAADEAGSVRSAICRGTATHEHQAC